MRRLVVVTCIALLAPLIEAWAQTPTAVPSSSTALRQQLLDEQPRWIRLKDHRQQALDLLDVIPDSQSLRRRLEGLFEDADASSAAAALAAADSNTSKTTWSELTSRFARHIVTMAKLQMKLSKLERPPRPTPAHAATPMPESAILQRLAWMSTQPATEPAWAALRHLATRDAEGLAQAEALATNFESARQRRAAAAATGRGEELAELRQSAQAEVDAALAAIVAAAPAAAAAAPKPAPHYDLSSLRSFLHAARESIKLQGELTRDLAAQ